MAGNPYALSPLCVAQVDPSSGRHLRAYFFLGAVPRAVREAARRGRARGADPRRPEWAAADGATLRDYYGARWREALTAADPPAADALSTGLASGALQAPPLGAALGGGEDLPPGGLDFGDLSEVADLGGPPEASPVESAPGVAGPGSAAPYEPAARAGPPVYSDLAVYPEDTVFDLRLKLRLASGVPPYRQHLFLYANEEGPVLPYQVTVDGAPIAVDWRALARQAAPAGEREAAPAGAPALVAGLAVEPRLEERREGLRVTALDTHTLLAPVPGIRITRAYFVDLYAVVPPLGAAERPRDNLAAVLRDRYQFDLLYYGGLLKYWPQLSPDACNLALTEPGKVGAVYPALDPSPGALQARFAAEQVLADAALRWRPAAARGGRAPVAVTSAAVWVAPAAVQMRVAVRNVFDWIPTGPRVAAVRARFEVDAALLAEAGPAGPEGRRGGLVPVTATKRHVLSYAPQSASAVDWFVAHPPRRDSVSFALARGAAGQHLADLGARAVPFAYLTVHADGAYEAAANWREDDRVGFDAVAAEVSAAVAPTVADINAMGAAAFPVGGELALAGRTATAPGVALGAITASAYWPYALSTAAFREVKDRFRAYEKAGLVGIRGLQQAGAYSFAFRKGIAAYDPRLADRATFGFANQYAWLTDAAVAARWAAAFQGRAVRVFHRATDLRIEVVRASSLAEFELIRRYMFAFLDGLLAGPGRLAMLAPARGPEPSGTAASQRLRRLQERDPDLFDLKKYDRAATVYSVLCQSGRQPHVYDEAEVGLLGAKRRARLVKYWNFTENGPAFYECPSPRYPHLSFRAGQHPLGYCLPCCKKTQAAAGSHAALTNEGCLARRAYAASEGAGSRHVLIYGKPVPVGRASGVPREVGEGLFLDALPAPYGLYLVGVEQAAPSVPDAGFAYALAYALSLGGAPPDDTLAALAAVAGGLGDAFHQLAGGAAGVFPGAGALADAILGAFVRRDAGLSPFGPGGAAAGCWPAILADLARRAFGIEVVTLSDPDGSGSVVLSAEPEAAAAITGDGECARPPLRLALFLAAPAGTYPLAAFDPRLFLRTPPGERWMTARRTFGDAAEYSRARAGVAADGLVAADGEADAFVTDGVTEAVRAALLCGGAAGAGRGPRLPDLALVARCACRTGSAFAVLSRLVNMRGLCYGAILRGPAGDAYVPVSYSACPADGTPTAHGPRPAGRYPRAALDTALAGLNTEAARSGGAYAAIVAAATILDAEGRAAGFTHSASDGTLCFYHDPLPAPPGAAPVVRFPYDSRLVDEAAVAAVRRSTADPPPRNPLAAAASGRNRLYRLFLAEFSAALAADRNEPLRAEILAAVRGTRFGSAESVAALRRRLLALLGGHPDDLRAVRAAVARAYLAAPQDPGAAIAATIGASTFGFDRCALARLRAIGPHRDAVAAVRELMAPRIAAVSGAPPDPSNVYAACSGSRAAPGAAQCEGQRLAVPAGRLDDFYDILAADVRNPGKAGLLAAASAGVFDALEFLRRPGEHLSVSLGQ